MNTYYVKILLFTFLINTLVLPYYEKCENSPYNRSLIQNNAQRTTTKSRLLAQTQNHNPHYHNDQELKEIIDKLNDEAIKKYQQTHDTYEQLKEVVEKNGTKLTGGNGAEPMSRTQKELFETYEEMLGHKNDIMLKSGMYPNDDDKSDKSTSCEYTDTNNMNVTSTKGKDKYLKHLKHRCIGGICSCSVGSAILTMLGLAFAKKAALFYFKHSAETCASYMTIVNMFNAGNLNTAIQAGGGICLSAYSDIVVPATGAAATAIIPYSIAIYVLIAITVILIILYIWLYKKRKNSFKHECKKHLCK
ncbi:stevor PIR protein,putative [Plasmodium sp. DRC-Itaito]|nr:stevor PIR protein,putative [Plasmodium sp. DRC-Itaito]